METTVNDPFITEEQPARPQFLKILCILSFVACGLMILGYLFGTFMLGMSEETIGTFWNKVVESNPIFADVEPVQFFHELGMICLYCLIANIFSLFGVIMMWRLEKIGFFIYAIAELVPDFFSINIPGQEKSVGGTIFGVCIDVLFIVLYAVNLKYMNGKVVPKHPVSGGM